MKEILSLGIGNCGIALTEQFLTEIAQEHLIDSSGKKIQDKSDSLHYPNIFFDEFQDGKFISRSVLIDSDCQAVSQVMCGKSAGLFGLDNYCCEKKSTNGNFGVGYYNIGAMLIEDIMNKVRRKIEICDHLDAISLTFASSGGTGSGLGSLLLQKISEEYHNYDIPTNVLLCNSKSNDMILS